MHRLLLVALFSALLVTASGAATVYVQPHDGTGTLFKSSWYPPDGLDGDAYCWDNFTLAASKSITEVHWRGGYEYHPAGTGQAPVSDFEVSIYRSIGAGTQPDLGAGGRLVHYFVGGNAGETPAGPYGGVAMFDYAFTLPSPFPTTGGVKYWVQIEAWQGGAPPSYAPDWGFAAGMNGDNSHFRFITGSIYQTIPQDLAFSLVASDGPSVTINASESPIGSGSISGAGAYPIGSTVSLMATANPGWGFVNWTENGVPVRTQPNWSFTATVDRTLVANFVPAYTITTSSWPPYAGTTTGGGVYNEGATVTLEAIPNPGFVFSSWSDGATTAIHSFPAASDLAITAFFDWDVNSVTYDFDAQSQGSGLPQDITLNGLTAHFSGGFSVQAANVLGFTPIGFSGMCLYPNSVFGSDLGVSFSEALTGFSILYATGDLVCNTSSTMRVTAYLYGVPVGTATSTPPQGTYPTGTLAISVPTGFNSVVVHWDHAGSGCQDYAPIFLADIVTVTRAASLVDAGAGPGTFLLYAPAPSPFTGSTVVRFALPTAGDARLAVYGPAGRLVRTLVHGPQRAGEQRVAWDGLDDAGRRVSPGVYFLDLEANGARVTHRVVFVR